jgi:hypothetical protein
MKKVKNRAMVFILLSISPMTASGADWYVDNAAIKNNDGSSWVKAWKSFGHINWGKISPGGTVYISGGKSSKTY